MSVRAEFPARFLSRNASQPHRRLGAFPDARLKIGSVMLAALILVVYLTFIADPTAYSTSTRSDGSTGTSNAATATSAAITSSPQDLNATQIVRSQIMQLLKNLQNRNLSDLQDYYTNESVLTLTGCTDGLGGRYTGLTEIKSLYANYENGMAS